MTLVAVNIHNHTYSTSVMLIAAMVKSFFLVLKFTICHIIHLFVYLYA